MTRSVTDIVFEGQALGVVGGVIASIPVTGHQTAADVPVTPTGGIASTDVQGALAELDAEKLVEVRISNIVATGTPGTTTYLRGDGTWSTPEDNQTAAEVPFTPTGGIAATNVQNALAELDNEKLSSVTATQVSFSPTGGIAATNVQNALAELDAEKLVEVRISNIVATGTPDATTYLRGDGTWSPSGVPEGAWTAYTPTWTAVTTNPAIGDGTITGAYQQIGKTVHFRVNLSLGSTSTVGSGNWHFGLPVAAAAGLVVNHGINVAGYAEDAAVQGYMIGAARMQSASAIELIFAGGTPAGAAAIVGSGSPFAWASGDFLRFSGSYEAA